MTAAGEYHQRHQELLAEAVRVLTEAARLTRPVLVRDDAASDQAGHPVWVPGDQREPADWAEFVTSALAGAAANIGGIEAVLAGRPGSWEADGVRQLLSGTVGHDGEYLFEHRTDPVTVDVYVDELMVDNGTWTAWQDAEAELDRRYNELDAADADDERYDELGALQDRLQELRQQDWAAYGQAVKAAVEAAARSRGLRVPVVVNVDLDTFRLPYPAAGGGEGLLFDLAEQLLGEALLATPLPGDGRTPLQRLFGTDEQEIEP